MPTTTYSGGRVSSCVTPAHHKPSLDPNPAAGVPFGGRPCTTATTATPQRGRNAIEALVTEFRAQGLPLSDHAVRRMLTNGQIPGAWKMDDTTTKSHWIVRDAADSVRRYLNGERGERRAA